MKKIIVLYNHLDHIEDELFCLDKKSNYNYAQIAQIRSYLTYIKKELRHILLTAAK